LAKVAAPVAASSAIAVVQVEPSAETLKD